MILRLAFAVIATFSVTVHTSAQQPQQAPTAGAPSGRQVKLQPLYRAGIAQSYIATETTKGERRHSDGAVKPYERTVTSYLTLRCLETSDGFSTVLVNIDSLTYTFKDGDLAITYDSQKDITPKNFADLTGYMGSLNRSFELFYSPYGDVTKIAGDNITWMREYLDSNAIGADSVMMMIWTQSVADEALLQIGDMNKRIIPGSRMAVDSTWKRPFLLRTDGVIFRDTVRTRFAEITGGVYRMQANDTIAVVTGQKCHIYGVPYVSTVSSGSAVIDHTTDLTTTGTINAVRQKITALIRCTAFNETYDLALISTMEWKLTGQYQW
jgi:hypothetical protein